MENVNALQMIDLVEENASSALAGSVASLGCDDAEAAN